jgi:hypothetical protein
MLEEPGTRETVTKILEATVSAHVYKLYNELFDNGVKSKK